MKLLTLPFTRRGIPGKIRYWVIGVLVATFAMSILAPFGTDDLFLFERILYWLTSNALSAVLMFGVMCALVQAPFRYYWQFALGSSAVFALIYTPIQSNFQNIFSSTQTISSVSLAWHIFLIALLIFIVQHAVQK